ncbi:uncharacterized protein LOC118757485 [Rhagoletis pomonella]|uniref:uncharacterized protein LOC118757485 n=1 Tax=Rhagoletis pomonella TaxID=28610 RepID=UPI0017822374|nr:uncharacterized protein LOC118757485 [Rhagoletis pomonella]
MSKSTKSTKGNRKKNAIYHIFFLKMMASTSQAANKRSRASMEQLSGMLDFFLENPGLAGGKFHRLHGKMEHEKKWEEMASKLNAIGGAQKSAEQWRTVWRDLKSRTSVRVRDRKRQQALTGNKPVKQAPLTELEERVVAIIGSNYIEGHESVAENVPMNLELQLAMEEGEEIVFLDEVVECEGLIEEETRPETPKTPTLRTPRRGLKRKREEEQIDVQNKFLEIAKTQADATKMLSESFPRLVDLPFQLAGELRGYGEGLKACADAINNLARALGPQ